MPKIIVINRKGEEISIEATPGLSVMENIRNAGVEDLLALCGGVRSCATCHVIVEEQWMSAVGGPASDEVDLLDSSDHKQPTSRLSCQITMNDALDGLRVTIAPED